MASDIDPEIEKTDKADEEQLRREDLEAFKQKQLNQTPQRTRINTKISIQDDSRIKPVPAKNIPTEAEIAEARRNPKIRLRHKTDQVIREETEETSPAEENDQADESESVVIPNVVGMPYPAASNMLLSEGLDVYPYYIEGDSPEPIVVSSQPEAGSEAILGQTVTLMVARKTQEDDDEDKEEDEEGEEGENSEPAEEELAEAEGEAAAEAAEGEAAAAGAAGGEAAAAGGAAAGAGAVEVGAAAGGTGIIAFLAGTAEVWVPALLIILLTIFIVLIVVITPVAICNSSFAARVASLGFCEYLKIGNSGSDSSSTKSDSTNPQYDLDIVITGAYRPGAIVAGTNRLSAHGRGEAVDIALRNPTVPMRSSDPRIAQLVSIAKGIGFTPATGNTLDEYANPTEGATGGHVHIEFNAPNGTTFCDGTAVSPKEPADLVKIPPSIPVQGASDPRLRPCMLSAVEELFTQAGYANP